MRQIREIVFNKTEEEKSFSNQFLKMKKQYLMKKLTFRVADREFKQNFVDLFACDCH